MQSTKFALHSIVLLHAASIVVIVSATLVRGEEEPDSKDESLLKSEIREARQLAMDKVARSLTVVRQAKDGALRCDMVDHSVLNWTDNIYHPHLAEGTLWVWHDEGLPQAVAQVFGRVTQDRWTIGFYTLSSDQLSINDGGEIQRVLRESDYQPQAIPNTLAPAEKMAARTLQLKQLAKRFDAYNIPLKEYDPDQKTIRLRLLTQPIHRYSSETSGVLDGAIFGFVHGGTNVQVVMLIEARAQEGNTPEWTVGFGRLDTGVNYVQLDKREFFREETPPQPWPSNWPSNYFGKNVPWRTGLK
jgi:hypothetical protein